MTKRNFDYLKEINCITIFFPKSLTHVLQLLHLTINGPVEKFLIGSFQDWYAKQVSTIVDQGKHVYSLEVILTLGNFKLVYIYLFLGFNEHLRNVEKPIINALRS